MKIGVDISQIAHQGTGVARLMTGLTEAILNHDQKHRWHFLYYSLRQPLSLSLANQIRSSRHQLVQLPVPPTAITALWNHLHRFRVEWLLGQLDWFISSDWAEPPSYLKKATIVHDLAYLHYPETVTPAIRAVQSRRLDWVKQETKVVFADSQTTRQDLIERLQIKADRIVVNYPGVTLPPPAPGSAIRQKYRLDRPYILSVGKLEPRKNLERLVAAFNQLNLPDLDLVLVGPKGWGKTVDRENHPHVRCLGFVPDAELAAFYQGARLFVYPSLWEGFGFPVIEAMQHGVPVVTSDHSSLREIAADAALLVNPLDVRALAAAIKTGLTDAALRRTICQKGKKRAQDFTWKQYYSKLITVLTNQP